ncbi:DUF4355 domain-containing protein [Streptococcus sp. NLN76]|uniref:DUF4355 domain-containing protein n=1 Tax=Streptococcus sp. NLN76 TaxID=2822800 RepID=UPI0018AA03A8|nr:DUF4355 domain-containing protein [Streptococcus sp. NLN76]MBF8970164.1 DUF4355 domain-containing protein [Streptococcus sp. NLN76]
MAEEIKDSVEQDVQEQASTPDTEQSTEKTFTQAEMDEIIQQRLKKAEKSYARKMQEQLDEAEKLRQMNAEQKAEYEQEKQAKEIADLKAQLNRNALEKEASKLLSEAGIIADDEILSFVVKEDAEGTQEAINRFSSLVNEVADKKVSEMLKGNTPKKIEGNLKTPMTEEEFRQLSYTEQATLYQENPELYAQLSK